ncbi:hypothetical protein DPMN_145467 [Dreissena polymorpha]|uniref:Uncharacterized protein n=1 Tax=Dreissena polymorpha TaxID=45954 RepID=A0A9D4F4Z8_DREPO|nr:hypothetical protein DPMN_145467 [Dreissena polymorpha]
MVTSTAAKNRACFHVPLLGNVSLHGWLPNSDRQRSHVQREWNLERDPAHVHAHVRLLFLLTFLNSVTYHCTQGLHIQGDSVRMSKLY